MKKHFLFTLSISLSFLLTVLFLSSCSSEPESMKVIPKDAVMVMDINVGSLSKKVDMQELSELKSFSMLRKELRSESKQLARFIDEVMEDPAMTGINLRSDVFFYMINDRDDDFYFCFSAQLNNKDKFVECIEELFNRGKSEFDIQNKSSYSIGYLDERPIMAWDDRKVVFATPDDWKEEDEIETMLKKLITLDAKQSISNNRAFTDFYRNRKDMSMWLSFDFVGESREFRYLFRQLPYDLSDTYVQLFLNFEKNKMALSGKYIPNKEMKNLVEKYDVYGTFDNDLLKYFPKQSLAIMSGATNTENYYKMMTEFGEIDEIIALIESELELDLKETITSFKGSFVVSLHGFENREVEYKGWDYVFDETNATHTVNTIDAFDLDYLFEEDKEKLNKGETVLVDNSYNYNTLSLNIKKALDQGFTFDDAVNKKNVKVDWYIGGWEYSYDVPKKEDRLVPLFTMATNLKNKETLDKLISREEAKLLLKEVDHGYKLIDSEIPLYMAYNNDAVIITSDEGSMNVFAEGGYKENLGAASFAGDIKTHPFYGYLTLNYEDYPEFIKKMVDEEKEARKVINILDEFLNHAEVKAAKDYSFEFVVNTNNKQGNTLSELFKTIDKVIIAVD